MSKLRIIMYHYVRGLKHSRYPEIKGLDYELFRQQLKFLKENFSVVTMEEVVEMWNSVDKKLPENAVLLTFDDGYIDHFTMVYPLLHEYHMQGSFFIPGMSFAENKLLDVNKIHFILASADIDCLVRDIFEYLDEYRSKTGGGFLRMMSCSRSMRLQADMIIKRPFLSRGYCRLPFPKI